MACDCGGVVVVAYYRSEANEWCESFDANASSHVNFGLAHTPCLRPVRLFVKRLEYYASLF